MLVLKIFFTTVFSFLSIYTINGQCYALTYKETTKFPDFAIREFNSSGSGVPYTLYLLKTNGINSEYKYNKNYPEGSSSRLMDLRYFKNIIMGETIISDFLDVNLIGTVMNSYTKDSWKIYKDTTYIKGIKVLKASNFDKYNNQITAYYAPDLTINEGPAEFNNLPGLIIKLETVTQIIELVEYQVINNCLIALPEDFDIQYISNHEWEKHCNKTIESFIKR